MKTFKISSELGIASINAECVEDAKSQYASDFDFDFDVAAHPGSWYLIAEDGVQIEGRTECMP